MVFTLALASLAPPACGGSSAPAPNAALQTRLFLSSACKKDQITQTGASFSAGLQVITDETGLAGLRCVAWQRANPGEVKLDLYNFENACGATWTGTAALFPDGSLHLGVANPSCTIARCGKCLYDWSFDIGAGLSASAATPVDVTADACLGQQATTTYPPMSIGPTDHGIRCTFADYGALNEQAATTGTCGKAGWPCTGSLLCGSGSFTSTGTCDPGLVCDSSAAENEPRCLVPCTTTADCPRADAWLCLAGLCRPAN
jgi:hypothetical protein